MVLVILLRYLLFCLLYQLLRYGPLSYLLYQLFCCKIFNCVRCVSCSTVESFVIFATLVVLSWSFDIRRPAVGLTTIGL